MLEDDRVILSRLDTNKPWLVVGNPRVGFIEKACSMVLNNMINRYAETENCGVITRMVRFKDIEEYSIDPDSVLSDHVLTRDDLEAR